MKATFMKKQDEMEASTTVKSKSSPIMCNVRVSELRKLLSAKRLGMYPIPRQRCWSGLPVWTYMGEPIDVIVFKRANTVHYYSVDRELLVVFHDIARLDD